jgi:hypothetical protein
MDVATIVLTASSVIIILQVVSIILIVKNKKNAVKTEPVPIQANQPANDQRDFRKRRDDNRFSRKPGFEPRQRPVTPVQPPPTVDHMEKSLRDINLKLKNAERDQEDARKKIRDDVQGPLQGGGQNQNSQRRFDNNQNRPNRGRDDDFRRRDRHGRPNNNQFRDRDQNRSPGFEKTQPEQAMAQNNAATPAPVFVAPVVAPKPAVPVSMAPVVEKDSLLPVPENTEILHGRKVLVRRRIVTPEEQAAKNASETAVAQEGSQANASAPAAISALESSTPVAATNADVPQASEEEAQPIKFGR